MLAAIGTDQLRENSLHWWNIKSGWSLRANRPHVRKKEIDYFFLEDGGAELMVLDTESSDIT
jgi:hypothetical protein